MKAFEKKEKSFQGCQIGGYQFKVGSTQVQTKIQKKKKLIPFMMYEGSTNNIEK